MANVYDTNPIVIDTVSSDVDIALQAFGNSNTPVAISRVELHGATANDVAVLKNANGDLVAEVLAEAGKLDSSHDFAPPYRSNGLKLVAADNTLTSGDILIYVV